MPGSSSERDQVEVLAEEFVARHRRGERPALTEYTGRLPDRADEIRELFPALVVMEQLKPAGDRTAGFDGLSESAEERLPERLGDYRILREVGRGGMGVVYEAEQVSLGRHVALKVMPSHALLNPTYLERFRREAKAAAKLHHTNIVPVFGVGEADRVHFYAMQFIRGEALDKVLADVRRLRHPGEAAKPQDAALEHSVAHGLITGTLGAPSAPSPQTVPALNTGAQAREPGSSITGISAGSRSDAEYSRSVARIGLQAADALAYAHKQGVLHRDVKPSNLLLDLHGTVWITDFGLAKEIGLGGESDSRDLTHAGDIVGTIRFMAPERFDGQSLPQSDIYSLGATLYEMLALQPAFDASHRAKLIEQVMHLSPPVLARIDRRIPRDLDTIIRRCLAKDPRDRYATAEALAEDLRRFLADRPIKARRATLTEQVWRWRRRNPALASLSAAVFGLLLVVAVGSSVATLWLRSALNVSEGHRRDAVAARQRVDRERWDATFEQAKANRLSRRPGQRIQTLQLLRQCAREAKALDLPPERMAELRNAVIATLAMPDLYLEEVGDFSPDHRADFDGSLEQFALADAEGNCSIRRVSDQTELFRIPRASARVTPCFSHDGRYLALLAEDGWAYVWERTAAEWQLRASVKSVNNLSFGPDDRLVALSHPDGSLSVYEMPAAALKYQLAPETIGDGLKVDLHPTEPVVACASYFSTVIQVRDLRSGKVLAKLEGQNQPCCPAWHPSGRDLIVPDGEGGKIHHFEWHPSARTLTRRRTFATETGGPQAAFNRAGDRLAVIGWNNIMYLFDFGTGGLLFQTPPAWRQTLPRFDAGGTRLAGAVTRQGGKLGIWRVADGRDYRTLVPESGAPAHGFSSAAVHPDGRILAAGVNSVGVGLWDLPTGRPLSFLPHANIRNIQVAFDRSGAMFTSSWSGTFRWPSRADAAASAPAFGPPELLPFGRGQTEFVISEDGRVRAKGYGYGYGEAPYAGAWVQFADQPAAPVHLREVVSGANVSISPDNHWVAAGRHNGNIHIWEVKDGNRLDHVTELPGVGPFCRFSPHGRWLWTGLEGGRMYQVGTWEPGPACEGTSCAFSPHGNLLATTVSSGIVILFDARSGRELARLEDPNLDFSLTPVFSPDGAQLITLTDGNLKAVHVWDLRRIRRSLKEMDLDWDAPDYPPERDTRVPERAVFVRADLATMPANWKPPGPSSDPARWQRQAALYSVALAFQPVSPEAYFRRGCALNHLKMNRDAVADFDRALALRPGHAETYHHRAHAHEGLHSWNEAQADFTAALERKPLDAHLLERRGRCRLNLDRVDDGVADLEWSLAIKGNQPELRRFLALTCNNRAWILVAGPEARRDAAAALRLTEKALRHRPDEPLFLNTRGVAEYRNGNHSEAIVTLNKSLERGQEKYAGYDLYFLAMCHANLKDEAKAWDCLERAQRWHDRHGAELSPERQQELREFRAEADRLCLPLRGTVQDS